MKQPNDANVGLMTVLSCASCGTALTRDRLSHAVCCANGHIYPWSEGVLDYTVDHELAGHEEVAVRDRQADTYLAHAKVLVHAMRFRQFVAGTRHLLEYGPVLDLGCGPGPTTGILLAAGGRVIAVDFSRQSLAINRQDQRQSASKVLFVRADLTKIRFVENSAGILVMSDFLQHLGDRIVQRDFLQTIFRVLKPGGAFYLSFFNASFQSLRRADISGNWGGIRYIRNRPEEVIAMLPEDVVVDRQIPMNICASPPLDRLLARLPLADRISRWILLTGHRQPSLVNR